MIDLVTIKVKAGDGGDGVVSFFKLLNMRYGKPDGGDGGNGGNVFAVADKNIYDLEGFRGRNEWKAQSGQNGRSSQQKGKDGEDLVLTVPLGTIITLKIKQKEKEEIFSFDLKTDQDKVLVAKGGTGGRGNTHTRFKKDHKGKKPEHWDIFNRAQKGRPGESLEITLELKYLAQVGLIGLPNAGKSSLLSVLTNAHPKIANYPFTTLSPNIGVLITPLRPTSPAKPDSRGYAGQEKIVIADIPGIIEGASQGKGLGLTFLKHIERTNLLVHVIDISDEAYEKNYRIVRSELKLYSAELIGKKEIIVLNKIDLLTETQRAQRAKKFKKPQAFLISAITGEGVEKLKQIISSLTQL